MAMNRADLFAIFEVSDYVDESLVIDLTHGVAEGLTNINIRRNNMYMSVRSCVINRSLKRVLVQDDNSECAICLQAMHFGSRAESMGCVHKYHHLCITKWLMADKNSCPICRFQMPTL